MGNASKHNSHKTLIVIENLKIIKKYKNGKITGKLILQNKYN